MQTYLNLILPDVTVSVPALKLSRNLPTTLEFQRLMSYEDLGKDQKPSLEGTIGQLKEEANHWFIQSFEDSLLRRICSNSMIEMFDSENSESFFILASSSDPHCLGPLVPKGCLGIFRHSIAEISDLRGYLVDMKQVKFALYNKFVNVKCAIKDLDKDKEDCVERTRHTERLNKSLSEYLKNLKKSQQLLLSQKEKIHKRAFESQDFMCVLCENSRKNVVMLPCGHIYTCPNCLGRIPLGKKLPKSKRFPCILCRGQVSEVRIVNYS